MWKLYEGYVFEVVETVFASKKVDKGVTRGTYANLVIRNYDLSDPVQSILGYYLMHGKGSGGLFFHRKT